MRTKRVYADLDTYLKREGISGSEFARMLGVSRSLVSHVRAGRRQVSLPVAVRIANAARIPVESLLKRE